MPSNNITNNSQILFKCGELDKIADATTKLPYSSIIGANPQGPAIESGKISVATFNDDFDRSKAFLYFDDSEKRYVFTGPVWWNDIQSKPIIANNITYTAQNKRLNLYELNGGVITTVRLPFVNTTGDTLTGHLYFSGVNANSSIANSSQIVFGSSANNYIAISATQRALILNPSTSSSTDQIKLNLADQSTFPKGINASGADITADTFTGLASNATADPDNNIFESTYMSYSRTTSSKHTLTFSTPDGSTKTWTENDTYPYLWTWNNGSAEGPTASIGMKFNDNDTTSITVSAIPAASLTASGILTTQEQSIAGKKIFNSSIQAGAAGTTDHTAAIQTYGPIKINNVELYYNTAAESLDFIFA